jgi:hypothetical protein
MCSCVSRAAAAAAVLVLRAVLLLLDADQWGQKAIGRKTTGTGRMRHLKDLPRRFKNGFREGEQPRWCTRCCWLPCVCCDCVGVAQAVQSWGWPAHVWQLRHLLYMSWQGGGCPSTSSCNMLTGRCNRARAAWHPLRYCAAGCKQLQQPVPVPCVTAELRSRGLSSSSSSSSSDVRLHSGAHAWGAALPDRVQQAMTCTLQEAGVCVLVAWTCCCRIQF